MNMVKVKTAELEGAALDYAVACCLEECEVHDLYGIYMVGEVDPGVNFKPSTDWSQGGPLIEKYGLSIGGSFQGVIHACVSVESLPKNSVVSSQTGPTHLIAACRAIVAAKLGDVVDVPGDLVGQ